MGGCRLRSLPFSVATLRPSILRDPTEAMPDETRAKYAHSPVGGRRGDRSNENFPRAEAYPL